MGTIDLRFAKSLHLPRVGQLGFVVTSIEQSLPYYASFYGLDTWFQPKYVQKEFRIGSEQVAFELDLTFAYSGNCQIELIQATGQAADLYHRHLAEHGEGLHHLGFYVNNLDERVRVMQQLGIAVLVEGRLTLAGGGLARFVYCDTKQLCGTVLELIEVRLYGMRVPQTWWMMHVATLTGDIRKTRV